MLWHAASEIFIKLGTGKAVITETGKALLRNLQNNDTAITEGIRRDYWAHQVTDGSEYGMVCDGTGMRRLQC